MNKHDKAINLDADKIKFVQNICKRSVSSKAHADNNDIQLLIAIYSQLFEDRIDDNDLMLMSEVFEYGYMRGNCMIPAMTRNTPEHIAQGNDDIFSTSPK